MRKRCPECNGTKTLMKLGGIRGVCTECDGKGYIEVKEKEPTKNMAVAPELKPTIKTTSRKKKKKVRRKG